MEINHFGNTVLGVVPTADVVESRMVVLTSQTFSYDFGSRSDLPGCKVPATAAESTRARYCVTWAQDNRQTPIYQPVPSYTYALRNGWDQTSNVPFSATVYLTQPGHQEGLTIPSGVPSLAFGEGIYTVPSGAYVYSAEVEIPGSPLAACNTAEDVAGTEGMLKYSLTNPVAEVYQYESATGKLTFKILH